MIEEKKTLIVLPGKSKVNNKIIDETKLHF